MIFHYVSYKPKATQFMEPAFDACRSIAFLEPAGGANKGSKISKKEAKI